MPLSKSPILKGDLITIASQLVTLEVNITAVAVTMDVRIVGQTVNLNVDIVAQTVGNITIDIAAQSVGNLNVNIAASAVTLNINISSQTANLNVNIAASAATVTVSVTGTANISITGQTVELHANILTAGSMVELEDSFTSSIDSAKWTTAGTATVASSVLTVGPAAGNNTLQSKRKFKRAIFRANAKFGATVGPISLGFTDFYTTTDAVRFIASGSCQVVNARNGVSGTQSFTPDTNYHEYVIIWTQDRVEFFIDGVRIFLYEGPGIPTEPIPVTLHASDAGNTLLVENIEVQELTTSLFNQSDWQTHQGTLKNQQGTSASLAANATGTPINYPVPAGKRYLIYSYMVTTRSATSGNENPQEGRFDLTVAGASIGLPTVGEAQQTFGQTFPTPLRVDAGEVIRVDVLNLGSLAGTFHAQVTGFEVTI